MQALPGHAAATPTPGRKSRRRRRGLGSRRSVAGRRRAASACTVSCANVRRRGDEGHRGPPCRPTSRRGPARGRETPQAPAAFSRPPLLASHRRVPLTDGPFPPNYSVSRKTNAETRVVAFPLRAFIFQKKKNILEEGGIFPFPPKGLARERLGVSVESSG